MSIKNASPSLPPVAPPLPGGIEILCAASQAETKLKDKESDANAAEAKVPFNTTNVSHEPVAADGKNEAGNSREAAKVETGAEVPSSHSDSDSDNVAIAALKTQDKSFPQVLHEILAEPECQSIVHWLPNGSSFIIADKQRFSGEILPKYFRVTLLNSFIRKLNRWGFRRVKSSCKGEESSFAHINFVRDKPWLCLKMWCKSKPSFSVEKKTKAEAQPQFHRVSSAKNMNTKNKKKKAKRQSTATAEAAYINNIANAITTSFVAPPTTSFLTASGMVNRAFVPTYSNMGASSLSAASSPIRGRRYLAANPFYHQERTFLERQMLIAQMHQQHQLQLELQHLGQFSSSGSRNVQSAMMAQYARDNNMLNGMHFNYRSERK